MKKNLIFNLIATGAFYFAQWYNIILLAKFTSTYEVGAYMFLYALSMPIFYFFSMGLRNVVTSDKQLYKKTNMYIANRIMSVFLGVLCFFVLSFFYNDRIAFSILILFSLIKTLEFLSDIMYGFWQNKENFFLIALFQLTKVILLIIVSTFIIYKHGSLESLLISNLVIYSSIFILEIKIFNKEFKVSFNFIYLLKSIKLYKTVLPLGFSFLLINMINNLPRFLLERFSDLKFVGIFSAIFFITMIGTVFMSSLTQVAIPKLRDFYNISDRSGFLGLLIKMAMLGLALASMMFFISIFFGKDILNFLYGPEYSKHYTLMIYFSLGLFFTYSTSFLSNAMIVINQYQLQMISQIISIIILLISLLLGLSFYGAESIGKIIAFSDFIRSLSLSILFVVGYKLVHR